jgi:large repetitive protein
MSSPDGQVCYLGAPVGRGRTRSIRFALVAALIAVAAGVVAATASALAFDDAQPCPVTIDNNQPLFVCPGGSIGTPYSLQVVARGGCEPEFVFKVVNGALPAGLSMSSSGLITGTPQQAGKARFWLQVHDIGPSEGGPAWCTFPRDAEREFTITIDSALRILTNSLPQNASTGVPYSAPLQAALVSDPASPTPVSPDTLTWTVVGGTLPPGLALSNGLISGTPTTEGAYQFQVQASLDSRKHLQTYTLTVRKPLSIVAPKPFATTPQPTSWEVGVPFSAKLAASGGTGTYTWSLLSGTLPTGFALAADGTVVGTTRTSGPYRATLRLTDTEGRTADYAANIVVAPRLAVSTLALRLGKAGRLYRAKVVATGGVLPKRWKLARGPLPRGIRFDRTLGVLSGTPTKAGRYRLTFQITDGLKVVAVKTLRLDILDA